MLVTSWHTELVFAMTLWCVSALVFLLLWLFQQWRREADVVDFGWAAMIAICAAIYTVRGHGDAFRRLAVGGLAVLWGVRLGQYLLRKRVLKPGEDSRYAALRADWGTRAGMNFFLLFQLNAFLVVLLTFPLGFLSNFLTGSLRAADCIGLFIGIVAILGESLADAQLQRFVKEPGNRGQVCNVGLWRFSRHPNYFFEWVHWWAYLIFAAGVPNGWVALIPVLVMYVLLTRVTGIPPAETQSLRSKGDRYREYQRTTNSFIPWLPRRSRAERP